MRKTVLMLAVAGMSLPALAQKSNIRVANNAMSKNDLPAAKAAIDAAVTNSETSSDGKAWFVRGQVYLQMQYDEQLKSTNPYREADKSFRKALELGHKSDDFNGNLQRVAYFYYNEGLAASNAKQYDQAYDAFGKTVEIFQMDGGQRFKDNKSFDTVATESRLQQGIAAYANKKYDVAAPIIESVKSNPMVQQVYLYQILADMYDKTNNEAKFTATVAEGRKLYPGDAMLKNSELNYYIKGGKQEELVKKLEEAVAQDPSNGDLAFNLGNTYMNMAFSKTGDKLPANYTELLAKSEAAYGKALQLKPANPDFNYNMGALYFNQAAEVNTQMNAITGASAAEMKKYDGLKVQKEALFKKSLPFLEKAYTSLSGKTGGYTTEEANTLRSSMIALQNIYATLNMKTQYDEIKQKMSSLK